MKFNNAQSVSPFCPTAFSIFPAPSPLSPLAQSGPLEGGSLLSLACSSGYVELVQMLLQMRSVGSPHPLEHDMTALYEACQSGHRDIVKLLLDHGADANLASSTGNTPLMVACTHGHTDIVRMLLKAGAKIEDHNENGHTPLMEAASAGHVEVAKVSPSCWCPEVVEEHVLVKVAGLSLSKF